MNPLFTYPKMNKATEVTAIDPQRAVKILSRKMVGKERDETTDDVGPGNGQRAQTGALGIRHIKPQFKSHHEVYPSIRVSPQVAARRHSLITTSSKTSETRCIFKLLPRDHPHDDTPHRHVVILSACGPRVELSPTQSDTRAVGFPTPSHAKNHAMHASCPPDVQTAALKH